MSSQEKQPEIQKVAIYIRVSTDEQVEKYGRELQESAIRDLISARKHLDNQLEFAGDNYVYFDDGVSGTTDLDERHGFVRLKEDILNAPKDSKPFDAVAVYKIDRFARRLKVLIDVIDFFEENEIKFISVNESIDTSTPFGKAMLGIIGVIAELEIETIKMRTQAGIQEAGKRGVALGSNAYYGLIKDPEKLPVIFEEEAKTVRWIFDLFVNKKLSSGEIATRLKENKILSPQASAIINEKRRGKITKKNKNYHWTPVQVRRILADEIYIGRYYYAKKEKGKILPKDKWKLSDYVVPQVIDHVTFAKAQKLIEKSKHEKKTTQSGHTYLLSGLLTCENCFDKRRDKTTGRRHWVGVPKTASNGTRSYSYSCGRKSTSKYDDNCNVIPLPAEEIEKYVVDYVESLLEDPKPVFDYQQKLKSTQKGIEHLQKREEEYVNFLNKIPARRDRNRELYEHGHISSMAKLKEAMKEIDEDEKRFLEKLQEIQKEIAEHTLSKGYIESIEMFSKKYRSALTDVKKDRQKVYDILHALIEEIIVYSRPVKETDTVAGRKKKDQRIPHRLHFKLKLPQEIVADLIPDANFKEDAPLVSSRQKNVSGVR
tara:strand:+ start:4906 stop:6702 length:1797 start_codon:yes stop_codon:yes gene_type:complete